jgi:hypothetical protein
MILCLFEWMGCFAFVSTITEMLRLTVATRARVAFLPYAAFYLCAHSDART